MGARKFKRAGRFGPIMWLAVRGGADGKQVRPSENSKLDSPPVLSEI